jgi:hypothetical protein
MLVYPDSSDLIRFEREKDYLLDELATCLELRGARLVLSSTLIHEFAQPFDTAPRARVMPILNRLEAMPHLWFRGVDIEDREMDMAIRCFSTGSAWTPINPFVNSYVETLVGLPAPLQDYYRRRSLAETVWDQLAGRIRAIGPYRTRAFQNWLAENRAAILAVDDGAYNRQVRVTFGRAVHSVASRLARFSSVAADDFVEHLWKHPDWCPAARLSFEVSQRFQADTTTSGEPSDVGDLVRMQALPYVDVFVADASKRAYIEALRTGRNSRLRDAEFWKRCNVIASLPDAWSAAN